MIWKVLKTEADYQKAINRTLDIFDAKEGTAEDEELSLLLVLVKDYEDKHVQIPTLNPIEVIKLKMEEMDMQEQDLETIIGDTQNISSILSGKTDLSLKTAQKLKSYFHLPAEVFLPAV